ncbi:unnamed protein product [Symbiodinium pilosum]|uniref:Sulfotransferase domain-containing protein n=1 Tax=Symbiodinium pilosum TaxID=2952 RepID=A0A812JPM8_SYMPI|nr:unnamed protein product [Symbiodinium pilosum]
MARLLGFLALAWSGEAWEARSACDRQDEPSESSFLQHGLRLEDSHLAATEAVTSPEVKTFSLFVKFHKVAGSTWRDYVDTMTGQNRFCSGNCGNPAWPCEQDGTRTALEHQPCRAETIAAFCHTRPTTCTFHGSLGVMYQATLDQNLTVANYSDLAGVQNLWPDSKRFQLYWRVEWARAWLPMNMLYLQNKRILVTTILRDPVEKIRSYYYYRNFEGNHTTFLAFLEFRRDYVAGNWTMEGFEAQKHMPKPAETFSILNRSCCEYETWLGQGSVDKAKITLSTQFDLVGITERMNESLVSLGKLYGLTAEEIGRVGRSIPKDKDNSDEKLDWTDEEKSLATYIATNSLKVYDFGNELFVRQYLALFNSEENMKKAVARFEAVNPPS